MNMTKDTLLALLFIVVGSTVGAQNNNTPKNEYSTSISTVIDTPPKFFEDVKKYLADSMKYPVEAKEKNIEGKVYVYCVIEKNGSVSHVKILRSDNAIFNKEAMRVVSTMPKWTPAKEKGVPQKIEYSIVVVFKL